MSMQYLSVTGLKKTLELEFPVHLVLAESGNQLCLDLIIVDEKYRNKGIGTKVMQILINYASEKKMDIVLTPSGDYGSNVKRLRKFYKRFKFKKLRNRYYAMKLSLSN